MNFLCALSVSLVISITVICEGSTAGEVTCRDMQGRPVDWFIAYKLPELDVKHQMIADGLAFYYMDVNEPNWKRSPVPIDERNQPIAATLNQIYGNKDVMHIMYNDENPDGQKSESRGHTKGVVGFAQEGGVWLVHSVPKFPTADAYEYPGSGRRYGQTFLCMSLKRGNVDNVVNQLRIMEPYIYSYNVPPPFNKANLQDLIKGKFNQTSHGSLVTLTSKAGQDFYSFGKGKKYNKDLYSEWLAPWVKDSIYVESWLRGGEIPSICKLPYKVMDVRGVGFNEQESFEEKKDHSKWAATKNKDWTCIGGINRMFSQEKRGGGVVCLMNSSVNKNFRKIIQQADCEQPIVHYSRRNEFEKLK